MKRLFQLASALVLPLVCLTPAHAAEHHGTVMFAGFPVPGATVTVLKGTEQHRTVTDIRGIYSFSGLTDGVWALEVKMLCFVDLKQSITVGAGSTEAKLELQALPQDQIHAQTQAPAMDLSIAPSLTAAAKLEPPSSEKIVNAPTPQKGQVDQVADSLLVNGSVTNAATSIFSQSMAFGNTRARSRRLYNGGIGVLWDNSAFDARSYSLSGFAAPKASYNRVVGLASLGGPIRIPSLLQHGPDFFAGYQWTHDRDAKTQSALVPTASQRDGDFSQLSSLLYDPVSGQPFPDNQLPVSPQTKSLLTLYPLPNVQNNPSYNLQIPTLSNTHQDAMQARLDKQLEKRDQVYGTFAFQNIRASSSDIFGFTDRSRILGLNASSNWSHRFNQRLALNLAYRFNRLSSRTTPYWQGRANISEDAGITGNNQDPFNWGPPTFNFSSGIASLSDAQAAFSRNMTNSVSASMLWTSGPHNVTYGGDLRRQQFNYFSQQDPRGTFSFTGAATRKSGISSGGSDFADFILGVPDASSIAYGNADKYLRQSIYDFYVNDDWRVTPDLTINVGVRWEYGAPVTEIKDRLVNLDITPGFALAAAMLASSPTGPLTGIKYPNSLIRPYRGGWEPRIGVAWKPLPASSMLIRAGYGIYYDTSVYQSSALLLAQQSPLSKSLNVENTTTCPLTLADGFNTCSSVTPNTFAVDPNFRGGYSQSWQLSLQRDLPGSFQLVASYLGIKGTHAAQRSLPNTYAPGGINSCPSCPAGFTYLSSNANSTREAGQVQLRRRLHNGLSGNLQYTYARALDNASILGGQGATLPTQATPSDPFAPSTLVQNQATPFVAQDWRDLAAERGRSSLNQRHLLNLQLQYTTGMGVGGGTLMQGWKGSLLREWTGIAQVTVASGLPETPIYSIAVPGTGVTGTIRPDITSAPVNQAPTGLHLNPAAYVPPSLGNWGNARRNSIDGPNQLSLNGSFGRTFRFHDNWNLDFRTDFTNLLNHVAYTGWNAVINSPQFGAPSGANPMRSVQTSLRMRF